MKLTRLNYFHEILTALVFSLLIVILVKPWLLFCINLFNRGSLNDFQFYWQLVVIILSIIVFRISVSIKKIYFLYLFILFFVILNICFIYMAGWQPVIFYPLLAVLILAGYRFIGYESIDRLHFDTALMVVFFTFNLAMQNSIGISIDLFNTILFIFCMIAMVALSHSQQLGESGHQNSYRLIYMVIGLFFLVVLITSLIFGISIQNDLLELVVTGIAWIYDLFKQLLLLILYPLVRLIAPVMAWIIGIFENLNSDQEPRPQEVNMGDRNEFVLLPDNREQLQIPTYVYQGLLFVIILILVYLMIRRIRKRKKRKIGDLYEERESVFTLNNLKEDLIDFFFSLIKPLNFKNNRKRDYDTDNPVMLVRKIYYLFLIKANSFLSYRQYQTPNDYYNSLTKRKSESITRKKELKVLTQLYNKARYYQKIDQKEAEMVQKIWKEFEQNH